MSCLWVFLFLETMVHLKINYSRFRGKYNSDSPAVFFLTISLMMKAYSQEYSTSNLSLFGIFYLKFMVIPTTTPKETSLIPELLFLVVSTCSTFNYNNYVISFRILYIWNIFFLNILIFKRTQQKQPPELFW